ncbi:MAG TPA: hypothetical protein VJ739_01770 [Gemmataceae bacterium]|nr:hypothetical protein [Gemmataceae bacterium]
MSLLFLMAALLVAVSLCRADEPKTTAPAAEDFGKKILVVQVKTHNETKAMVLEKVRVKRLGDRSFLVGKGVDDGQPDTWYKGRTVWVGMSDVVTMFEFDSLDDLHKVTMPGQ